MADKTLAQLALQLVAQMNPEAFGNLGENARAEVLRQLSTIDEVAADRMTSALKAAAKAPAPVEQWSTRPAFHVPDEEIAAADTHAANAVRALLMAEGSDWTQVGSAMTGLVASVTSLAHSVREGCVLLRAIAGAAEHMTRPTVIVNAGEPKVQP